MKKTSDIYFDSLRRLSSLVHTHTMLKKDEPQKLQSRNQKIYFCFTDGQPGQGVEALHPYPSI